jgi:hypothetical protein
MKSNSVPPETQLIDRLQIHCDAGTQTRVGVDSSVVDEYAERMAAGDVFPPLDVFFDGSKYYLADGFHRLLAATHNKLTTFPCSVHSGTIKDALWFAIGANKTNGIRRNHGDVRRAVELALNKFPGKSQQEIADQVGCNQSTVARVKADVMHMHNVSARRTDSKGRNQPTSKKRKPQPAASELSELEQPLTALVQAGLALIEIRESKLYRSDQETFDEYVHARGLNPVFVGAAIEGAQARYDAGERAAA